MRLPRKRTDRGKVFEHRPVPLHNVVCDDTTDYRTYVLEDGTRFYSMTSMLKMTADNSWLEEWRERMGPEAAEAEARRCADRGEAVHLACEKYLNNEPMEECLATAGAYINLFLQLKDVLDRRVVAVVCQEIPLYSRRMRVAGRVDLVCYWLCPDGKVRLAIVDFKTSNHIKTRESIEDYQCQLAGYAQCFHEMYGERPEHLENLISCERSVNSSNIAFTTKESLPKLAKRVVAYHKFLAAKIPTF